MHGIQRERVEAYDSLLIFGITSEKIIVFGSVSVNKKKITGHETEFSLEKKQHNTNANMHKP